MPTVQPDEDTLGRSAHRDVNPRLRGQGAPHAFMYVAVNATLIVVWAIAPVGALAVGALAIGRLAIRRAVIRELRIEELEVGRLRVRDLQVEPPPVGAAGAGGDSTGSEPR